MAFRSTTWFSLVPVRKILLVKSSANVCCVTWRRKNLISSRSNERSLSFYYVTEYTVLCDFRLIFKFAAFVCALVSLLPILFSSPLNNAIELWN